MPRVNALRPRLTLRDAVATLLLYLWLVPHTARYTRRLLRMQRGASSSERRSHEEEVDRIQVEWARKILDFLRVEVELEGALDGLAGRRVMVISNHQSHFDVLSLVTRLPLSLRFVAKRELVKVPLFGPGMVAAGHVIIDRRRGAEAKQAMRAQLSRSGASLFVFPEGTRSRDGRLGPLRRGAFEIAHEAGLPLLPVAVSGTRFIHPPGGFWLRVGLRARLRVGAIIETQDLDTEALRGRGEEALRGLMAALDGEGAATG